MADGVTACRNGRAGAEIACSVSAKVILDDLDYYFESKPEKTAALVLSNVKRWIRRAAEATAADETSYASTLCFVCVHKQKRQIMTFVLGDSRVYALEEDGIRAIHPAPVLHENAPDTTVTPFAEDHIGFGVEAYSPGARYLLCTDGCWRALFFTDESSRLTLREEDPDRMERYLDGADIMDDCSFIAIA